MRAVIRRLVLLAALVLAGCGGSEERWGGATEKEAREVISDPDLREQLRAFNANAEYPTQQEIDDADLRKVTLDGQEAWEYDHPGEAYCIYVYEDPELESFTAQVSACVAD